MPQSSNHSPSMDLEGLVLITWFRWTLVLFKESTLMFAIQIIALFSSTHWRIFLANWMIAQLYNYPQNLSWWISHFEISFIYFQIYSSIKKILILVSFYCRTSSFQHKKCWFPLPLSMISSIWPFQFRSGEGSNVDILGTS